MLDYIKDTLYALFEWPPKSRLEREIWYTERALERYRARAELLREEHKGAACCAFCACGELSLLVDKITRVETQLKRLHKVRKN